MEEHSSNPKITAYKGIFEEKLKKIIKDIKKVRKDPTSKDRVKKLLEEAKALKKQLKQHRPLNNYRIVIPLKTDPLGEIQIEGPLSASPNITIIDYNMVDTETACIEFIINTQ